MNERKSVSVRLGDGVGAFKALSLISVINFMERDFWRVEEEISTSQRKGGEEEKEEDGEERED